MRVSRRGVLRGMAAAGSVAVLDRRLAASAGVEEGVPLVEFGYEQVAVRGPLQVAQQENVRAVLMGLDPESLVRPFREMALPTAVIEAPVPVTEAAIPGMTIPTVVAEAAPVSGPRRLGGWYDWKPDYDYHHDDAGFAPAHCYGQWMSAVARMWAGSRFGGAEGDGALRERVLAMDAKLAETVSPGYFEKTRFPCYSFDKLVGGLTDAHRLAGDERALATLDAVLASATPVLPGHAVDRDIQWRMGEGVSFMWDESYTMPENLYLAATAGAPERYRRMAEAYLDDRTLFGPLARRENVLSDQHAYSYTNALCSAMQAYLTSGSRMHLEAARNGFAMIEAQSFVTGGWGPDELLRKPGYNQVADSLTKTHNSFETPCGSYAHMKLTRYLLRATRDGRYGDSMERVMWNTVLGALPLDPDGRAFYYADYNVAAKRVYSVHRWPCCSGTLPQVAADYGINSYLRGPGAVWVVLYQPSEVRWTEGGSEVRLTQTGEYPDAGLVRMEVTATRPVSFALRLRVPRWAGAEAQLRVNGRAERLAVERGFASVERVWRTGDVVELELPMRLRVEAMVSNGGAMQLSTLAVLRGPLVLFVLREPTDVGPLEVATEALLAAEQTGPREWRVRLPAGGTRRMVPFTEVGLREYSTYVKAV